MGVCQSKYLMPRYEMRTAILLPARFIVLGAEWPLFAPAHRIHAVGGNAERNKVILGSLGAAFTEANVVFRRAALIAMALDGHADLRIRAQEFRGLGQVSAGVATNIGFVEVEIGVLHVLLEQFTHALVCGRRSCHGCSAHGDTRVCGCGAARSRRGDGEGRRFRWIGRRGALRRYLSHTWLDVEGSGIRGCPAPRDRIATFHRAGRSVQRSGGLRGWLRSSLCRRPACNLLLATACKSDESNYSQQQSQLSQTTILHLLPPSASLPGLSR